MGDVDCDIGPLRTTPFMTDVGSWMERRSGSYAGTALAAVDDFRTSAMMMHMGFAMLVCEGHVEPSSSSSETVTVSARENVAQEPQSRHHSGLLSGTRDEEEATQGAVRL